MRKTETNGRNESGANIQLKSVSEAESQLAPDNLIGNQRTPMAENDLHDQQGGVNDAQRKQENDEFLARVMALANRTKVKVSPKYQVVIPKVIREELGVVPGEELWTYTQNGSIHFDRVRFKDLKGILHNPNDEGNPTRWPSSQWPDLDDALGDTQWLEDHPEWWDDHEELRGYRDFYDYVDDMKEKEKNGSN